MRQVRSLLALGVFACTLPAAAQALLNGGFETAAIADGTGANGVAASWGAGQLINPDSAGNAVVASGPTYTGLPQPFSGEQYANLGVWLSTGIEQTFTVATPGRYAVTWADNSPFSPDFQRFALYNVSISQGAQTFSATLDAYHQGEWREHQTSAVLTPGTWTLRFDATRVTPPGLTAGMVLIDDVRISPIPEPAAASLLALGLAALAWRRRTPVA